MTTLILVLIAALLTIGIFGNIYLAFRGCWIGTMNYIFGNVGTMVTLLGKVLAEILNSNN